MPKVLKSEKKDGTLHGWLVLCPACKFPHVFDARWQFDGNMERPTFSPSILVLGQTGADGTRLVNRCHSFVRNGKWQFLGDCQHAMANQTVDIPDISAWIEE